MAPKFIVMLEDDADDRLITRSALNDLGFDLPIRFLSYSDELFELLDNKKEPSLILLDIHSRPLDGIQVLRLLKRHPVFKKIPVVILSELADPMLTRECYLQGANSFVTKPLTSENTRQKINVFFNYWLEVAELV